MADAIYLACPHCGRDSVEGRMCARCRLDNYPTPLSEHIGATGDLLRDIAEAAHLSEKTLKRCLHGEPMDQRSALAIHAVTGIPIEVLRAGGTSDDGT